MAMIGPYSIIWDHANDIKLRKTYYTGHQTVKIFSRLLAEFAGKFFVRRVQCVLCDAYCVLC